MFHQLSLVIIALLMGTLAGGLAQAQDIQRGTLKRLDVENRVIVVTIGGTDHEMTLADDCEVPGGQGKSLAEKFRTFRQGGGVEFKAFTREGKQVVQGIRPAETGQGARARAGKVGDGPQRGKLKEVDVVGRKIALTVDGKDVAFAVTEQTDIRGASGDTLVERMKGLDPGADVMFLAADRDGKKVLVRLAPVRLERGNANAGGRGDQTASPDLASQKPLNELGIGRYHGYAGGLYPDGQNVRPKEHEAAGLKLAARIQPLDPEGRPDPAGKIILLSIGMSNTSRSSRGFQGVLGTYGERNPRLDFVNGAQDSMTAAKIVDPGDGGRGTQFWNEVDERIKRAGASRAQVQAIWIKQADAGPRQGFPQHAKILQTELTRIVQILPQRFPNARLAYLSSRSYGGFATTPLNPEPYAYESGFAVKWLIEEQIRRNPELNYDPADGVVKAPWLSWGPYLWANRRGHRAGDELIWERADFAEDGTHQSQAGERKMGNLLLDFFRSDLTTRTWFNRRHAGNAISSLKRSRGRLLMAVCAWRCRRHAIGFRKTCTAHCCQRRSPGCPRIERAGRSARYSGGLSPLSIHAIPRPVRRARSVGGTASSN